MNDLLTHVIAKGATAEPALLALVIRHGKALLAANDDTRVAVLKVMADFWIRHPALAGAGLDEVHVLENAGMHNTALQLLEVLEHRLPERDRCRFLQTFYTNAAKVVAAQPYLATPLMDRAQKVLTTEGAHGAVLHFLLDTRDAYVPWPQDPGARAARHDQEILFLRAHVERYHTADDNDHDSYLKSLERLFRIEDAGQGLARTDAMLQGDPSLLDLWGYRARRLLQANRLEPAIAGLAWIPGYLRDNTIEDLLLPLRLRHPGQYPGGPATASEPPRSALARGLLALRVADFPAAITGLQQAKPQVDGSHLFYLALAHLGKVMPGDRPLAGARFRELAQQYPQSPLSYLAVEFAAQLEAGR